VTYQEVVDEGGVTEEISRLTQSSTGATPQMAETDKLSAFFRVVNFSSASFYFEFSLTTQYSSPQYLLSSHHKMGGQSREGMACPFLSYMERYVN
jgi:hypothetical protein